MDDTPGLGRPQQASADKEIVPERTAEKPVASGYVMQLEKRIDEKDDVIGLLKGQLVAKDQQITDLSTRFGNLSDRFAKIVGRHAAHFRAAAWSARPVLGQRGPAQLANHIHC